MRQREGGGGKRRERKRRGRSKKRHTEGCEHTHMRERGGGQNSFRNTLLLGR